MAAVVNGVIKVARYGWLRPDEVFQRVFDRAPGYLISTVGGETTVPHKPPRSVPACAQEEPDDWLLPSGLVTREEFLGGEWVHDHAVRGWVIAKNRDQYATRCADLLAAGNGLAWLVTTNFRCAVVIPAWFTDIPAERLPPPAPLPRLNTSLVTWWEVPMNAVLGFRNEILGRSFEGSRFVRVLFADGSFLLLRQG